MHYNVRKAEALDASHIWVEFEDGKRGIYDMAPVIGKGVFRHLEDPSVFRQARSDGFTVVWPHDLDIAPEELYENCVEIQLGGAELSQLS